ncbi:MAG: hypothetical protein FD188_3512 [Ignavibacteria bacterium]|nr:MAG: hypothetical protein FD188_3512 [Ignavibacteria bacterium]
MGSTLGRTSTGDVNLVGKRSLVICKDCVAQLGADLQANMDQVAIRGAARIFTGNLEIACKLS